MDLPYAAFQRPPLRIPRAVAAGSTLFSEIQRLRYQVYCVERGFLVAENYPDGCEADEFDRHALHFCDLAKPDVVAGAVRIVFPSDAGLPLLRYCSIFPEQESALRRARVAEISRLVVSRHCREGNRAGIVYRLYRDCYQAAKRFGVTHLLAASEKSLVRLLTRFGFPMYLIGPDAEFAGRVTPFAIDIAQLDRVILSKSCPLLHGFLDGLEPEFRPHAA